MRASPALSPSSSPKDGSSGVIDGGGVSSPGAGVVGDGDGGTLNEQRRPIVGGGGGAKGDAKRVAGAGSGTQGISGQGLLESMDVFSLGCVIAEVRFVFLKVVFMYFVGARGRGCKAGGEGLL